MAAPAIVVEESSQPVNGLLPLENGDRLTRREFERRYAAMPRTKKAELIEGVVYMPSPLKLESHALPHIHVSTWLGVYTASTPGVMPGDNATIRLDVDNEVQPDVFLRLEEIRGGSSRITPDDYLEGAPELIIEIAASSASYDLHDKLRVYRRNGVQEYVIWRVYDQAIDWLRLEAEEYKRVSPSDGVIESRVFPGLRLTVAALLSGDLAAVLAELQKGLASEAHKEFVAQLGAD